MPLERSPVAYYEGNLPLPSQSADNDWTSAGGDFVVRVDSAAADLSWVDVTLGGADLDRDGAVTLDIMTGGRSELVEEGIAEDVPVFVCGSGDYRYALHHQHAQLTCHATTFGYEQPGIRWRLNGVQLPASGTGSVSVPAIATFPGPNSWSKGPRTATLAYEQSGTTLTVTADPSDGNYTVEVEVTVVENDPAAVTAPSSTITTSQAIGVLIVWEQAYYDAVEECVRRVRDINDRYAESHPWPRLNPGDPITRVSAVINLMRHDIGATRRFLLEQLEHAADVYAVRHASQQPPPPLRRSSD
jgi:hypothetical protein